MREILTNNWPGPVVVLVKTDPPSTADPRARLRESGTEILGVGAHRSTPHPTARADLACLQDAAQLLARSRPCPRNPSRCLPPGRRLSRATRRTVDEPAREPGDQVISVAAEILEFEPDGVRVVAAIVTQTPFSSHACAHRVASV